MIGDASPSFEVMNPELMICTMDNSASWISRSLSVKDVVMYQLKRIKKKLTLWLYPG